MVKACYKNNKIKRKEKKRRKAKNEEKKQKEAKQSKAEQKEENIIRIIKLRMDHSRTIQL